LSYKNEKLMGRSVARCVNKSSFNYAWANTQKF